MSCPQGELKWVQRSSCLAAQGATPVTCQLLLPHRGKLLGSPGTDISVCGLAPLPGVGLKGACSPCSCEKGALLSSSLEQTPACCFVQQPEHREQLFCGFIFVSPRGWKLSEGAVNAFKDMRAEFECYYCTHIHHVHQFPGTAHLSKSAGRR